jgi:uncharacterized protein DUF3311
LKRSAGRALALAGLPLLYILHNDFWLWDDPRIVLGLPVGLTYHVVYCFAATLVMLLLVRYAWPEHLEVDTAERSGERRP